MTSVDGLASFAVLGNVCLSHNQLTFAALLPLRETHILSLSLSGNPGLKHKECMVLP